MKQHQEILRIRTKKQGLLEFSYDLRAVVERAQIQLGLCTVFVRHSSASLVIQENADPSARYDLEKYMERIAPENDPAYTHTTEGPDDMPAHIRAMLTHTSENIPICDGRLALGTWQGLYLFEHRRGQHERQVVVHILGE
ncbi:MAG: secondary thiamine-phosphate synthase enzyme YjbQ [Planctomycetota bacterium]|nr:secondary thiamine-phosphate synthase enzyme YjbQ [Planctomycetota bacterium]